MVKLQALLLRHQSKEAGWITVSSKSIQQTLAGLQRRMLENNPDATKFLNSKETASLLPAPYL